MVANAPPPCHLGKQGTISARSQLACCSELALARWSKFIDCPYNKKDHLRLAEMQDDKRPESGEKLEAAFLLVFHAM